MWIVRWLIFVIYIFSPFAYFLSGEYDTFNPGFLCSRMGFHTKEKGRPSVRGTHPRLLKLPGQHPGKLLSLLLASRD